MMVDLKERRGLCVGGPADGKWQICREHSFYVVENPSFSFSENPIATASAKPIKQYEYVSMDIALNDEGKSFYLWRPSEQTPRETLEKLIRGYNNPPTRE